MLEIPRPPQDISPKELFLHWLPEKSREHGASAPREVAARFVIEGDAGGTFTMHLGPSGVRGAEGTEGTPAVVIRQSTKDFHATVTGKWPGLEDVVPTTWGGPMALDAQKLELLAGLSGSVAFVLTDPTGPVWSTRVGLGGVDPGTTPDATISASVETCRQILLRQVNPAQAFFAGQIHVTGDQASAMQLLMAMMSA